MLDSCVRMTGELYLSSQHIDLYAACQNLELCSGKIIRCFRVPHSLRCEKQCKNIQPLQFSIFVLNVLPGCCVVTQKKQTFVLQQNNSAELQVKFLPCLACPTIISIRMVQRTVDDTSNKDFWRQLYLNTQVAPSCAYSTFPIDPVQIQEAGVDFRSPPSRQLGIFMKRKICPFNANIWGLVFVGDKRSTLPQATRFALHAGANSS